MQKLSLDFVEVVLYLHFKKLIFVIYLVLSSVGRVIFNLLELGFGASNLSL